MATQHTWTADTIDQLADRVVAWYTARGASIRAHIDRSASRLHLISRDEVCIATPVPVLADPAALRGAGYRPAEISRLMRAHAGTPNLQLTISSDQWTARYGHDAAGHITDAAIALQTSTAANIG